MTSTRCEVSGVKKGKGASLRKRGSGRFPSLDNFSFADIVDRYKSSVVYIEVLHDKKPPARSILGVPWDLFAESPDDSKVMNIGTGFLFHEGGYILTNEHVIHDAQMVRVRFFGEKQAVPVQIVGTNYKLDLAVLKVTLPKKKNFPILPFGRSKDVRVGEWVVAIGCPLGLDHTVTVGVISAKERPITIGDRYYPHLIQTDAAINRGNSGGPLINSKGKVIGINTAVSQSSQGIGFAIAIDVVRDALDELMGKKSRK
jgi:serine protease Do